MTVGSLLRPAVQRLEIEAHRRNGEIVFKRDVGGVVQSVGGCRWRGRQFAEGGDQAFHSLFLLLTRCGASGALHGASLALVGRHVAKVLAARVHSVGAAVFGATSTQA